MRNSWRDEMSESNESARGGAPVANAPGSPPPARRRTGAVLLALAVALSLAGAGLALWQWRLAETARKEEGAARAEAEAEAREMADQARAERHRAEQEAARTVAALGKAEDALYLDRIALARREWLADRADRAGQLL